MVQLTSQMFEIHVWNAFDEDFVDTYQIWEKEKVSQNHDSVLEPVFEKLSNCFFWSIEGIWVWDSSLEDWNPICCLFVESLFSQFDASTLVFGIQFSLFEGIIGPFEEF